MHGILSSLINGKCWKNIIMKIQHHVQQSSQTFDHCQALLADQIICIQQQ